MDTRKLVLGMPTLIEFDTLEENVEFCNKLGLDFIEVNMNLPQYQPTNLNINKLASLQKDNNIFFTFHLPDDINVWHLNSKIRKAHWHLVIEALDIMMAIKSPIINIHVVEGVHFKMPDRDIFLYEKYIDEYLNMTNKFRGMVEEHLKGTSIKVAIENIGIFDKSFIRSGVERLLESEMFALTWDIGHDYSSGQKDRDFINANLCKLAHMHIHDAIGKRNHLVLYSGKLDINDKLDLALQKGITSVIETKTVEGLEISVTELKNRGYIRY